MQSKRQEFDLVRQSVLEIASLFDKQPVPLDYSLEVLLEFILAKSIEYQQRLEDFEDCFDQEYQKRQLLE